MHPAYTECERSCEPAYNNPAPQTHVQGMAADAPKMGNCPETGWRGDMEELQDIEVTSVPSNPPESLRGELVKGAAVLIDNNDSMWVSYESET